MPGAGDRYCYEPVPVRLTGEMYLRVCALDLDDVEAVLRFVNEFGTLGGALAHKAVTTPQGTTPFRLYSEALLELVPK
jgi:hypothetical protein